MHSYCTTFLLQIALLKVTQSESDEAKKCQPKPLASSVCVHHEDCVLQGKGARNESGKAQTKMLIRLALHDTKYFLALSCLSPNFFFFKINIL